MEGVRMKGKSVGIKKANGMGSVYKLQGNRRKPWVACVTVSYKRKDGMRHQKRKIIGYYETEEMAEFSLWNYNKNPALYAEIEKLGDNLWRVNGTVELETLSDALDVALPLDEEYDTLSGMVFSGFSSIPEDGSKPEVTMNGLHIQVETIQDHRVEKALVSKVEPSAKDEASAPEQPAAGREEE